MGAGPAGKMATDKNSRFKNWQKNYVRWVRARLWLLAGSLGVPLLAALFGLWVEINHPEWIKRKTEPWKLPHTPKVVRKMNQAKVPDLNERPMVLIPAGVFMMGCNDSFDRQCSKNEKPYHQVALKEFCIDKYEVTQADYDKCIRAQVCRPNNSPNGTFLQNSPVFLVTWHDAEAYCKWAGRRLPTEAEWEKAARGTDGAVYPWGNDFDGSKTNFCDYKCVLKNRTKDSNDGYGFSAPIGSYPAGASPYSAMDMSGNVSEWVADWYGEDYYKNSPASDPSGPDSGTEKVIKGGSWKDSPDLLRAFCREHLEPDSGSANIGFRCARDNIEVEIPTGTKPGLKADQAPK